jgi:hypothetical protein
MAPHPGELSTMTMDGIETVGIPVLWPGSGTSGKELYDLPHGNWQSRNTDNAQIEIWGDM